jgi:hypothetical protein
MSFRAHRTLPALVLVAAALVACGTGSGLVGVVGAGDAATMRFVNASGGALDLVTGGSVNAGNANIAPGAGIACFSVPDPSAPALGARQSGTTTDLPNFPSQFSAGGRYTLVAYPGSGTFTLFVSIPDVAVTVAGRSALRVFHASVGLGQVDVYVTTPGAALDAPRITGLNFGSSTGSFDVAAGAIQVRLTTTGTTTVVYDVGTKTFEAGKSYTLVISSATAALLVPDC